MKKLLYLAKKQSSFFFKSATMLLGSCALNALVYGANLTVDANFDNGRIALDSINQTMRTVYVHRPPETATTEDDMQCWQFKLSGITPGELVTIKHAQSLSSINYCYSYDKETWFRFPTFGISNLQFRFVQSSVYIAVNVVYPYGKSLEFAAELGALPCVTVSDLTTSEEGRAIKMFRITDPGTSNTGKRIVWVHGREHGFEPGGSWVASGFARWMASNDSAAIEFRKQVIAYVVPILDVDHVFKGESSKDEQGGDFYGGWNSATPRWKGQQAVKTLVAQLSSTNSLLAFFDFHEPRIGNCYQWCGTYWEKYSKSQTSWDDFLAKFATSVVEAGNHDSCSTMLVTNQQGSTTGSLAVDYAGGNWGSASDYVGAYFETSHFRDMNFRLMTREGYMQWGEAIGRALYKHIGGTKFTANIPPKSQIETTTTSLHSVGNAIGFTANGSFDRDGSIAQYKWDFGDGQTLVTTTPTTTHSYTSVGHFPVSLVVVDNKGLSSPPYFTHALINVPASGVQQIKKNKQNTILINWSAGKGLFVTNVGRDCILRLFTPEGRILASKNAQEFGNAGWIAWNGTDANGQHITNKIVLYRLTDPDGMSINGCINLVRN